MAGFRLESPAGFVGIRSLTSSRSSQLAAARGFHAGVAAESASLVRRLRKLEARRKPPKLPVRCVWWDPGESEPMARPSERLFICSWDHHPEPLAAAEPSR